MSDSSCFLDTNNYFNDEEHQSLKFTAEFREKVDRVLKATEERFLNGDNSDEEGWKSEALAVIADIAKFVSTISISEQLPCDENGIYMNLVTMENKCLTVELSSAGFRVCGFKHDTLEEDNSIQDDDNPIKLNVYYETPYALLGTISPEYRNKFGNELAQRLQELCT